MSEPEIGPKTIAVVLTSDQVALLMLSLGMAFGHAILDKTPVGLRLAESINGIANAIAKQAI